VKREKRFKSNLASLRRQAKITQSELAAAIKVSQGYYQRIEQGYHRPSPDTITSIAEALSLQPKKIVFLTLKRKE
jgi:transcriptional regulator with XRE-family HTH domain